MEFRNLEIKVHSASDLKDLNTIGKMDPYVIVSLSGDPNSKQKTEVDTDGGTKPKWKGKPMKFVINVDQAKNNSMTLIFKIMAEKPFGDKDVGEVYVPVSELLQGGGNTEKSVSYSVKTPSGKSKGTLNISYMISEKSTTFGDKAADTNMNQPIAPYAGPSNNAGPYPPPPPPEHGVASPYPQPPPPQQVGYYPPPALGGYGYPPPPQGYNYPGAPPPGHYGYPQSPGYPPGPVPGYASYGGYPPTPQVVIKPEKEKKKKKKNKGGDFGGLGLGIGAGLLGGLLIGDIASDASAAYDAGYDDASADFDF